MKKSLSGLAGMIAGAGVCLAASTPIAHFEMGEQELAGTGLGNTPASLLNSVPEGVNIPLGAGTAPIVAAPSPAPGSTHAMDFSGRTGYFHVADNLIHSTSGFCVEAWAKANNSPQVGGTSIDGVFSYGHGGVGYIVAQHGANWDVFVGGSGWKNIPAPVTAATWVHLAIAKGPDDSQVTLYVDGVAKGSFASTGVTNGCAIGDQYTNGGHRLDGQIDDVWFSSITGNFNPATDLHRIVPTDPIVVMPVAPVAAGTVAVSTTTPVYADIDNAGATNTLTISAVSALSGDTGKFTLVTPLPLNILPGETGTLEFTYAPGATAGNHNAVFTVTNNDANNTSPSLTLTGTAITDPNLLVPATLAFGTVPSTVTTHKTVQLSNSAFNNDLNVSLAIVGTDAAKFSIVDPNPPNSAVAPGAALGVEIACAPAGFLGGLSASLEITHNDPDVASPLLVSLTADSVPRYQVFGHFRMGEEEAAGGATVGSTPATLIDAAGDFDLAATGTPALADTGSAPATPISTHHMAFAGSTDYYTRSSNIVAASNATTNWILEAWVKPAELPAGANICIADGNGGGGAVIYQQGNHFGLGLGGNAFAVGSAPVVSGQWYHVALVKEPSFNGGRATLLVNGVIDHSIAFGGAATPAIAAASIGAQSNGQAIWNGDIDEAYYAKVYSFNPATDLHVTPPADVDGDDLADIWEDQYFGNNDGIVTWSELVVTDGSGDADGDNHPDQDEHDAGTNPQDANSFEPLAITNITRAGNTVTVGFAGVDGETYVLKKSLTLSDGFPTSCGTVTLSGTSNGSLQDTSATEPKAFYRVEKE